MSTSALFFLPWGRTGLAAAVTTPDDSSASAPAHAGVSPSLTLTGGVTVKPDAELPLLGPGDVTGLDPSVVIRTYPADGAIASPTELAAVDLAPADLPWAFTPLAAAPTTPGRLRPWLALVAVRVQDGVTMSSGPDRTVLTIEAPASPAAELPNLLTSWAWAHVQLTGGTADDPSSGAAAPFARLLAPRRLAAGSEYLGALVPAFAVGAATGLGVDPDTVTTTLAPAWTAQATSVTLPVYWWWRFSVGPDGDFGQLASALKAVRADTLATPLGSRLLDVTALVAGADPLVAGGALVPPAGAPPESAPPPADVAEATRALLADREVAVRPPRYGAAWSPDGGPAGGWNDQLNSDPRLRVAAALGTAVVHADRDMIAASAWTQVGAATTANQIHSSAALLQGANLRLLARHLAILTPLDLLQKTAPAHDRVRCASTANPDVAESAAPTVSETLADDAALSTRTSPAYRRLIRASGPARRTTTVAADSAAAGPIAPADLITALDPARRSADLVAGRVTQSDAPMARLAVPVQLATALAPRLAQLVPSAFLPGVDGMPDDCVVELGTNPEFVAAFLVGANSEAIRELVWRGLPVDTACTVFTRFWDGPADLALPPIDSWDATRGLNQAWPSATGGQVVVAIRARVLRNFPNAALYLAAAQRDASGAVTGADLTSAVMPELTTSVPPDVTLALFPSTVSRDDVRGDGSAGHPGYCFVVQEALHQPRFATDATPTLPVVLDHYTPDPAWTHGADAAAALYTPPIAVLIAPEQLLPDGS